MPRVASYGGRQVLTAALPGARRTAAETDISTGARFEEVRGMARARTEEARARTARAGAEFAGQAAQIGANLYGQLRAEEVRRADEIAVLNAENQLRSWENQRIYDPKAGALTVKGKDSFGLPETVNEEYTEVAGKIAAGLGTERQRAAFNRLTLERSAQLDLAMRRHVFGEMQRYEGEELQALVVNSTQSAIANATDPRRVGVELDRAVTAIKTHAPRLGLGPEQVEQQVLAVTSATHTGVIEQLLAQDHTKAAEVYFDETKSQIKGDQLAKIEKALGEGKIRKQAQQQADRILAAGGTLTEQRNKAKEIDDPELRDAVSARIEHEAVVNERAEREQSEATLRGAYDLIERSGRVEKIPPATWAGFSGSERSALRSYAEHLARGTPIETDLPTYYNLMRKAGDDPESFATENLLKYRGKLDEVEFKQLAGLQLSIRNGDRNKADRELDGFRTNTQILDDTLTLYGLDPSAKFDSPEGKAVAQLRRMLDVRVQTQANLTGKKPTNDDIQLALDGILSQSTKTPGSWWGFLPFVPFYDQQKRLIDATIEDVPASERAQIEQSLRRANRPISDATILNLFLEGRARRAK